MARAISAAAATTRGPTWAASSSDSATTPDARLHARRPAAARRRRARLLQLAGAATQPDALDRPARIACPAAPRSERVAGAGAVRDVQRRPGGLDDGEGDGVPVLGDRQVGGGAQLLGEAPQHRDGGLGEQRLRAPGQLDDGQAEPHPALAVAAHHAVLGRGSLTSRYTTARPTPSRLAASVMVSPDGASATRVQQFQPAVEGLRGLRRHRMSMRR